MVSYDEQTYRCKPNDTFRSISTQFYLSEKYERALLLFNRSHAMANDNIKHDPPILNPGQNVFIPQLKILEQRYASVIPDLTPLPPPAAAAPVGTVPAAAAVPVTPTGSVPPPPAVTPGGTTAPTPGSLASPVGSVPPAPVPASGVAPVPPAAASGQPAPVAAGSERKYRVRNNGEQFWEIAKHTLNNPARWQDIYNLNPNYNPSYPVQGGVVLRLPADAQVEPGDIPPN